MRGSLALPLPRANLFAMPLGPSVPEWAALRDALRGVEDATRSEMACVLDAKGNLWCASHVIDEPRQQWAMETVRGALHALHPQVPRGGHLGGRVSHDDRPAYLRSFAGTYMLLVALVEPVDEVGLHRVVDAALPEIERLTLSLPPPDGPESRASAALAKG